MSRGPGDFRAEKMRTTPVDHTQQYSTVDRAASCSHRCIVAVGFVARLGGGLAGAAVVWQPVVTVAEGGPPHGSDGEIEALAGTCGRAPTAEHRGVQPCKAQNLFFIAFLSDI